MWAAWARGAAWRQLAAAALKRRAAGGCCAVAALAGVAWGRVVAARLWSGGCVGAAWMRAAWGLCGSSVEAALRTQPPRLVHTTAAACGSRWITHHLFNGHLNNANLRQGCRGGPLTVSLLQLICLFEIIEEDKVNSNAWT